MGKVDGTEHSIDTGLTPQYVDQNFTGNRSDQPLPFKMVITHRTGMMGIDFRKLNRVTLPDPYTMPLIDDMLDDLSEVEFLSKLNLNKGFYQIHVKEEVQEKSVFCSPWGKFQFNRMLFGLWNAPATFQRLMQEFWKVRKIIQQLM